MRLPPLPGATRIGAAIAAAALVGTVALMWFQGVEDRRLGHEAAFQAAVVDAAHIVENRLAAEAQILNGLRAFILSSVTVTPEEWAGYVAALDLPRLQPGTRAIGLAQRITAADRDRTVEDIRLSGKADFAIRPDPGGAEAIAVIEHTAIDRPDAATLGVDLAADPIRQDVIARAMADRTATLSRPLPRLGADGLVAMMVLPWPDSAGGVAGMVFTELDLGQALSGLDRIAGRGLILTLSDAGHAAPLYRSAGDNPQSAFVLTRPVTIYGRNLMLQARSTRAYDAAYRGELMWVGMICSGALLLAMACFAGVMIALRRASVERLKDFAASAADWFWETGPDHRITWISPGIEASLGRKAEWYLGRDGIGLGSVADNDATRVFRAAVAARQPFRDIEYVRTTPNGRRRIQISALPRFDGAGRFLGYRGVGRDVTALRRYQARLRDALASLTEACLLYDDEGRLVASNLAARQLFTPFSDDVRRRPLLAESLSDLAALFEAPPGWDNGITLPLAGSRRVTLRHRATDRRFDLAIDPTSEGGAVMLFVDITAFEREQAVLAATLARAEAAHRAKSIFLANMSHELRTPLNAILGFSEIMSAEMFGPLGNDRYRDYARTIHGSGSHLLALITNILEMSRIEAGKRELQLVAVDVPANVAEVLTLLAPLAQNRGIRLGPGRGPDDAMVQADALALRQILINVLGNAIKFTGDGGSIGVDWAIAGTMVEIAIADDGPGIAPDLLVRLGRPFESGQAERSDVAGSGGTGLGLAISQDLARMQGGSLDIASTLGSGTTVTLRLPRAAPGSGPSLNPSEDDDQQRQEQQRQPR